MTLFEQLEIIEDPRVDANKDYELIDIIFLTIAAVLSGAKGWKAIKIFGEAQLDWLKEYGDFSNGIPTRHSIGRIIRSIKSEHLITCFTDWANELHDTGLKKHISYDGKVLRGSKHGTEVKALQIMTAMVVDSGLVIYQQETDSKTNEIPVMQSMLSNMLIKNAVITADAMHCQTKTAEVIRGEEADYVLQIKGNQKNLLNEVEAFFHKTNRERPELLEQGHYQEIEKEHGRLNERHYRVLKITDWLDETDKFKDSYCVIEVKRTRTLKNKTSSETSYYISSLKDEVKDIAGYVRRHWAIENSQHWILDVVFREDECQIYAEDGARNLATMRRKILNLVKEHPLKDRAIALKTT